MPKKWKQGLASSLQEELKGKTKEQKADILVEVHDEVNSIASETGVSLNDLKESRARHDRASWG